MVSGGIPPPGHNFLPNALFTYTSLSASLSLFCTVILLILQIVCESYAFCTFHELRIAVKAALDAIPSDSLEELLQSMHARCQAVMDARGMQTRF